MAATHAALRNPGAPLVTINDKPWYSGIPKEVVMAILTISRQVGSLGDEIAEEVARALDYTLIDKYEIHDMISSLSDDFSAELTSLAEESQPGFFDRMFRHQSVYVNLLSALIYDAAAADKVVIKGRGGQFLLTHHPNVLNVRVVAPFDLRVKRFQEREDMNPELAGEIIKKADHDRSAFIQYLYKKDVASPECYDLVFNTGKLDKPFIVGVLVDKTRMLAKTFPMSDDYRNRFKALGLKKRIEATLQKKMPNSNHIKVEADTDGTARIFGYIGTEVERVKAAEVTSSVKGVEALINEVHVAHFPVTTWP
jgi:cytidylate kinase